jgi:methylamine dehydrogenase heavy chain
MLCGDGKPVLVTLDDSGEEASRVEGEKFFDSVDSPVSDRGARIGPIWYFVDYEGGVHPVDVSGREPKPLEPWPSVSESDKASGWRPGGRQHVAAHADSGRLFIIMDAGREIWVFDVAEKKQVARFAVPNLLRPFLEAQATSSIIAGDDAEDSSFLADLARRMADWIIPNPGADAVVVTGDAEPVLIVGHSEYGAIAVLDARTGEHLRDIAPTGIIGGGLTVP